MRFSTWCSRPGAARRWPARCIGAARPGWWPATRMVPWGWGAGPQSAGPGRSCQRRCCRRAPSTRPLEGCGRRCTARPSGPSSVGAALVGPGSGADQAAFRVGAATQRQRGRECGLWVSAGGRECGRCTRERGHAPGWGVTALSVASRRACGARRCLPRGRGLLGVGIGGAQQRGEVSLAERLVAPRQRVVFTSRRAPASSRTCTMAGSALYLAAAWSGVLRRLLRASSSAPASSSTCTTAGLALR